MKIVLNGRMGGTEEIDKIFHPLIIDIRNKFNAEFDDNTDNLSIRYFLLVNGELVQYYDTSGVHKVNFSQKKNEISVDLCFANVSRKITRMQAIDMLKILFMESIEKIDALAKKRKFDLATNLLSTSFNKIFNSAEQND